MSPVLQALCLPRMGSVGRDALGMGVLLGTSGSCSVVAVPLCHPMSWGGLWGLKPFSSSVAFCNTIPNEYVKHFIDIAVLIHTSCF